jgi:hypothetical protein
MHACPQGAPEQHAHLCASRLCGCSRSCCALLSGIHPTQVEPDVGTHRRGSLSRPCVQFRLPALAAFHRLARRWHGAIEYLYSATGKHDALRLVATHRQSVSRLAAPSLRDCARSSRNVCIAVMHERRELPQRGGERSGVGRVGLEWIKAPLAVRANRLALQQAQKLLMPPQ